MPGTSSEQAIFATASLPSGTCWSGRRSSARDGQNADVIAVAHGAGGDAGVQVGFIRNGKILGSEFFPMQAGIEDAASEILSGFVSQFYAEAAMVPPTLYLHHALPKEETLIIEEWLRDRRGGRVELVVPQRGEKRALVEMVAKSANENLEQQRIKFLSDDQRMTAAMSELAEALDLPRLPRRIECFDISNIQGTNPVASMIVFEDGRPAKKEYRRFTIKTVEGPNDFASMKEVVGRRFRRAAEADEEQDGKWTALPDLVIIDGGKGQLNAALEALGRGRNAGADRRSGQGKRGTFPARIIPIRFCCRAIRRRSIWCSASATKHTASRSPSTASGAARRLSSRDSMRFPASGRSGKRHCSAPSAR